MKTLLATFVAVLALSACSNGFTNQQNFDTLPSPHTWQDPVYSYSYHSPFQTNADGSPNGVLTPDCVVTVFSDGTGFAHQGC